MMTDQKQQNVGRPLQCMLFTSCFILIVAGPVDTSNDNECTKNVLSGDCQLPNSTLVDTVYYIKMSRHSSSDIDEIITISLDPPENLKVLWHKTELTNRTIIDGSSIYPPREAKLVFHLDPDQTTCDDNPAVYKCSISALSNTGRLFVEEVTLHQDFTACTCSNDVRGMLPSYVSVVFCQLFIIYIYKLF